MIGIYDSGLGGLSVVQAVRNALPQHDLWYLADTAYCPYGPRSSDDVRSRALACGRWLVAHDAALIVVACNTASSAALEHMRTVLPVPVVGLEPGIKPAIAATRTRRIGVLATDGTLAGERFGRLVRRFASDVIVCTVPAPLLVQQVEAGDLGGPHTRALLTMYLEPLLGAGVDAIVLGCTHFNFLAPTIAELTGPQITIINTAPAVARQTVRVASEGQVRPGSAHLDMATTGDPAQVAPVAARVWGSALPVIHADA